MFLKRPLTFLPILIIASTLGSSLNNYKRESKVPNGWQERIEAVASLRQPIHITRSEFSESERLIDKKPFLGSEHAYHCAPILPKELHRC